MVDLSFTIRLTETDWLIGLRAWQCPALDIPSAYIKEAFDPRGLSLGLAQFEINKGPARVSWKGPEQPNQIVLVIGLGEELSPVSEEKRWKKVAVIAPPSAAIIAAVIAALATYLSQPAPQKPETKTPGIISLGPPPAPIKEYALDLRVVPTDLSSSGIPQPVITLNGAHYTKLAGYKITSDTTAIIDLGDMAKNYSKLYNAISKSEKKLSDIMDNATELQFKLEPANSYNLDGNRLAIAELMEGITVSMGSLDNDLNSYKTNYLK